MTFLLVAPWELSISVLHFHPPTSMHCHPSVHPLLKLYWLQMNTPGQTQFSAQQRTSQSVFKVSCPTGLASILVGGIDDPQLCLSANEPDYATCSSTTQHSLIAPRTEPRAHIASYGPSSPLPSSYPCPDPTRSPYSYRSFRGFLNQSLFSHPSFF